MDEQKKQKTNKIVNIVVNVVVGVILVVALLVTINNITSKKQGYTSMFGTAYMVVQSESMSGGVMPEEFVGTDKLLGFEKGDLIKVKVLKSAEARRNLEEGDIISFMVEETVNGERVQFINSHRIVEIGNIDGVVSYKTKGDHNTGRDSYWVTADESASGLYCVIGVVTGNAGAIGKILNFFNSSNGFLACIVIPSFLIVIYCAFNLVREILKVKKANASVNKAKYEEELIAKLRAQGVQIPADMGGTTAPAEQSAPPAEKSEGEKPTEEAK
ncbi:MAG: hypothetical protein J1F36_02180 [Clostridiales bacterium]|nr:hypothetical protein [Clostridiales bacterium]